MKFLDFLTILIILLICHPFGWLIILITLMEIFK